MLVGVSVPESYQTLSKFCNDGATTEVVLQRHLHALNAKGSKVRVRGPGLTPAPIGVVPRADPHPSSGERFCGIGIADVSSDPTASVPCGCEIWVHGERSVSQRQTGIKLTNCVSACWGGRPPTASIVPE